MISADPAERLRFTVDILGGDKHAKVGGPIEANVSFFRMSPSGR